MLLLIPTATGRQDNRMVKKTTVVGLALPIMGTALVVMVQTPPEVARSNATKWIREIARFLPDWPTWVNTLVTGVGVCLILAGVIIWLRGRRRPLSPLPIVIEPQKPEPEAKPRTAAQLRGDHKFKAQQRCPTVKIADALQHLCSLGYSSDQARLTLQQAFSDGALEVWGRPQRPVTTFQAAQEPKENWHHIRKDYWDDFKLSEGAFDIFEVGPQTEPQPHLTRGLLRKYWNLRVSDDELKFDWPEPPERPTPRPDLGPNGWMAG